MSNDLRQQPADVSLHADGPGVVPDRFPAARAHEAGASLARTGAAVLLGRDATADALVVAAAEVLGSRLAELYPQRLRTSRDGEPVHLHADSFDLTVDVGGVQRRRRDPDEDFVLVQCVRPAPAGGDSFAVDAHRVVDDLASGDPELHAFLTGVDVDLYGVWAGLRGLPAVPRVGRHVEYTRTGRRIVRRTDGAAPLHRDPDADRVQAMLARLDRAVRAMEPALPRFRLDEGDILVLDNYRCWHGRDAHTGERSVRILTLRSTDAR
ncbi:TauD/TfdA family dioxygenase [Streptomyces sp. WMMC500]|uniref:TauD/TfdA family dioxygenase n=1 Tax=Streptomyces sp. WMMC500 TaxID=3015154 RepID=UPI00248B5BCA|nr:TauD/TfdA family dioxygenase [Streptomyces sp. WMMC500]WBB61799.1 TauD/TfdA family dioxygenase [Streptomyces sp. WMMC500]